MKTIRTSRKAESPAGSTASPDADRGKAEGRGRRLPLARILVPVDFSDYSLRALQHATRLRECFGSRLILLHVVEPATSQDFTQFPLAQDDERTVETHEQRLRAMAKEHLLERHLEKVAVRIGNPFHEIVEAAAEEHVDLIVLASHGHTGVKRSLLGGTAERVVRHAPCPVLTVR